MIPLTTLEVLTVLRYMRATREGLHGDLLRLEEKLKAVGDGHTQGAILALAGEVSLLDDCIRKLWTMI